MNTKNIDVSNFSSRLKYLTQQYIRVKIFDGKFFILVYGYIASWSKYHCTKHLERLNQLIPIRKVVVGMMATCHRH